MVEKILKKQNNGILEFPAKIMEIFGHEDDEVIGCGGTIRKNYELGGKSHIICFGGYEEARVKELKNACGILGASYETLGFHEGEYGNSDRKIAISLRDKIIQFKPDIVITHRANGEYNEDHKNVAGIVKTAVTMAQIPVEGHLVKGILYTETHSLHNVVNLFVDISDQYTFLMDAMDQHISQVDKLDNYYKQLIDKKTSLRGLQAGCGRAEAFSFEPLEIVGSLNRRNLAF